MPVTQPDGTTNQHFRFTKLCRPCPRSCPRVLHQCSPILIFPAVLKSLSISALNFELGTLPSSIITPAPLKDSSFFCRQIFRGLNPLILKNWIAIPLGLSKIVVNDNVNFNIKTLLFVIKVAIIINKFVRAKLFFSIREVKSVLQFFKDHGITTLDLLLEKICVL